MELTAGDVWVMVSAALVLLMTPGLAFFYGGMARAKAALNMMMMSFVSIGLVGVVWVLCWVMEWSLRWSRCRRGLRSKRCAHRP